MLDGGKFLPALQLKTLRVIQAQIFIAQQRRPSKVRIITFSQVTLSNKVIIGNSFIRMKLSGPINRFYSYFTRVVNLWLFDETLMLCDGEIF